MDSADSPKALADTLAFLEEVGADIPLADAPRALKDKQVPTIQTSRQEHISTAQAGAADLGGQAQSQPPPAATTPTASAQSQFDHGAEVKEAPSLAALRSMLANFSGCALAKTATNLVFSDGNPQARVMLIGEAPGAEEDRQGKPFVGLSGQLLDLIFASIGYSRSENFYITNIIPWRPPGNRTPSREETTMCLPFVERHIELVDPDLIIFVGGTAAKTLLRTNIGISKLRGKTVDLTTQGSQGKTYKATAIFHPAYLLRSPGQKKLVWFDLVRIRSMLEDYRVPRDPSA